MSLFMMVEQDDKNAIKTDAESAILTLARSVDRVAQEQNLLKMCHLADLRWVTGELKAILASWSDAHTPTNQPLNFDISIDEVKAAVARERVQHLATALTEKIEENS